MFKRYTYLVIGTICLSGIIYYWTQKDVANVTDKKALLTPSPISFSPTPTFSVEDKIVSNEDWTPVEQKFDDFAMVLVPAGCFMMGSETGDDNEMPVTQICFDKPFWIDKYEVTNAQYGATGCEQWSHEENQPRNCIDWFKARDYCQTRNARLPTEAEWEYAARGPSNWIYPWGNQFIGANVIYIDDPDYGNRQTAPVGSKPGGASWVGAMDIAGNVGEWTNTIYGFYNYDNDDVHIYEYPYDADDGRELDKDEIRFIRVVRGGSFWSNESEARSANRSDFRLYNTFDIGVRCAKDYEIIP